MNYRFLTTEHCCGLEFKHKAIPEESFYVNLTFMNDPFDSRESSLCGRAKKNIPHHLPQFSGKYPRQVGAATLKRMQVVAVSSSTNITQFKLPQVNYVGLKLTNLRHTGVNLFTYIILFEPLRSLSVYSDMRIIQKGTVKFLYFDLIRDFIPEIFF